MDVKRINQILFHPNNKNTAYNLVYTKPPVNMSSHGSKNEM